VKTASKNDCIELVEENTYRVEVKARAEKGKANKAILKLLKRHFGKEVQIVSGFTSNTKTIEVID
jgi:uncharacterized protein (TIGR00251 family)